MYNTFIGNIFYCLFYVLMVCKKRRFRARREDRTVLHGGIKVFTVFSAGGGCGGNALDDESCKPGKFNCCDNWFCSSSSRVNSAGGLETSFKKQAQKYC